MRALDPTIARWRKSSRSSNTSNCVEVALLDAEWRKSTRCTDITKITDCIEVAFAGPAVGLRDSKNPTGPILTLPAPALTQLLRTV